MKILEWARQQPKPAKDALLDAAERFVYASVQFKSKQQLAEELAEIMLNGYDGLVDMNESELAEWLEKHTENYPMPWS